MIGHTTAGGGPRAVVVLHDWLGDTSSWDGARAYLDCVDFTWTFADLRGYGRSKGQAGHFTVEEAAADVIDLADSLGWEQFSIVGHSMSCLVALLLAQQRADRIDRSIVLTPPPPTGFGADEARLELLRGVARGDDSKRMSFLRSRNGDRLPEGWFRRKVERWRSGADPEAVAGFVAMFASRGLPDPGSAIAGPVLAVTGEQDVEPMRGEAVARVLTPICSRLFVKSLADCGHYPMEEAPPLLVSIMESFLARGRV